jgi:hypothetical protein
LHEAALDVFLHSMGELLVWVLLRTAGDRNLRAQRQNRPGVSVAARATASMAIAATAEP